MGFLGGSSGKESACQCKRCKRHGVDPWVEKIPWRRAWQPTPVFFPRKPHGQRSLVGCKQSMRLQRVRHNGGHTSYHASFVKEPRVSNRDISGFMDKESSTSETKGFWRGTACWQAGQGSLSSLGVGEMTPGCPETREGGCPSPPLW